MLEDRDGDGVFDHSTVFADRLTLPAGAVWHKNSLYVASPPDVIITDLMLPAQLFIGDTSGSAK